MNGRLYIRFAAAGIGDGWEAIRTRTRAMAAILAGVWGPICVIKGIVRAVSHGSGRPAESIAASALVFDDMGGAQPHRASDGPKPKGGGWATDRLPFGQGGNGR